jgi:adenosylcobinamide-phosphate synthase
MAVTLTILAVLIELIAGYPDWLLRSIGHPVTWMGRLIAALERRWNREADARALRRMFGVLALVVLLGVVAMATLAIQSALLILPFGLIGAAILASTFIAQRSLHQHVARVADALERDGLRGGREAVSHLVGRDTETLDEAGIARAAIESLAENFSDGVVAPVFWMIIAGLPGAAIYKAVSTADSMIGHQSRRYQAFGWAAARLDDLLNLPASRLSALLITAAAAVTNGHSAPAAWRAVCRDAPHHLSPNAGYPEAAMAGALGLALGGPRAYGGVHVEGAFMGDGRRAVQTADIRAALGLYRCADAILIAIIAALAAALIAIG